MKSYLRVSARRQQGRSARRRARTPIVSLVGYTNAGKSTLFNQLTGEDIYAADQLFATLDPTLRRMEVPVGEPLPAEAVAILAACGAKPSEQ